MSVRPGPCGAVSNDRRYRDLIRSARSRFLSDMQRCTLAIRFRRPRCQHSSLWRKSSLAEIFRPPYRGRTIMLTVFHFFQAIAFYGFGNWLPTLVNAQNHNTPRSAEVSFFITLAFPVGPLLWSVIAETYERKWQIVAAAVGTAIFGLLFATRTGPMGVAVLGILITPMTSLLGFSSRAYQAELFPTRLRARAVGFVYSWGRLSTAFTSLIMDFSSNILEQQQPLL
jgi:putative MFS transporter